MSDLLGELQELVAPAPDRVLGEIVAYEESEKVYQVSLVNGQTAFCTATESYNYGDKVWVKGEEITASAPTFFIEYYEF